MLWCTTGTEKMLRSYDLVSKMHFRDCQWQYRISWLFNLLQKFRVLLKLMVTAAPVECRNPLELFRYLNCCGDCKSTDFLKKASPGKCLLSLQAAPSYQQVSPQQWGSEQMSAWKLSPVPLAANCTHRVKRYYDFHYLMGLLLVSSSIAKGYFKSTGWFTIHFTQKCGSILEKKRKPLVHVFSTTFLH